MVIIFFQTISEQKTDGSDVVPAYASLHAFCT